MNMYDKQGNLRNAWYILGQSNEFNSKPIKKEVMELPFVVWRSKNGQISALIDRCPHRNAPLSEGYVKDDCIVCPYHGWQFNADGDAVRIPSETDTENSKLKHEVQQYQTQEVYGFVWIWMGGVNEPTELTVPFPMFPETGKGWKYFVVVTEFQSTLLDLIENFMDVPHTAYIHKGLFRNEKQLNLKANIEKNAHGVAVTYQENNDSVSLFSQILNPKGKPLKHTDEYLKPNVVRVNYAFGNYSFWTVSSCTPVTSDKTISYTTISYKFGFWNGLASLILPSYVRKILRQDVWIMKLQNDNIKTFGGKPNYQSTKADLMLNLISQIIEDEKEEIQDHSGNETVKAEVEYWV